MLLGLVGAFSFREGTGLAYAICLVLSVLYSVPPFRLKAVPGADWLINMGGSERLTPYAGWAATGLPVGPAGRLVLLAFCPLFAALYPLTQIYQFEEDTRRGDRTLALMLGVRQSLIVVAACSASPSFCSVWRPRRAGGVARTCWRWCAGAGGVGMGTVLVPGSPGQAACRRGSTSAGCIGRCCLGADRLAVVLRWGT